MRVDPVPFMGPISPTICFEQAVVPLAPPPLLFLSPFVAGGGNLTAMIEIDGSIGYHFNRLHPISFFFEAFDLRLGRRLPVALCDLNSARHPLLLRWRRVCPY